MKNKHIVNAVVATAGIFYLVGAIAQKSQIRDLGLGVFLATSLTKQQKQKINHSVENESLAAWQQNISAKLENSQVLLKNTEQRIEQLTQPSNDQQQWNKAIKRVNKLEKRFVSQQKQQNKMRSLVDKLKHKLDIWEKDARQPQSYTSNFAYVAEPTKITSQLVAQQPTTHVYIDGNNFKCSAYKLNLCVDYQALKTYLMPENGKIRLNYYDGRCQLTKFNQIRFHRYLERLGYQVTCLPKGFITMVQKKQLVMILRWSSIF